MPRPRLPFAFQRPTRRYLGTSPVRSLEGQGLSPTTSDPTQRGRQRVVVLGSGWGGFTFIKSLDRSKYDVTLVSPNTFFSFTPLLAQASVGSLDFRAVVEPVRSQADVSFHHAWCESISFDRKQLTLYPATRVTTKAADPFATSPSPKLEHADQTSVPTQYTLPYDKLVVAVGSYNQTFNTPGVKEYAWFLKDANDAIAIRWRILQLLEEASHPWWSEEEKRKILSFVIVGGGPTGSEFSAELHDLIDDEVRRTFPAIHPLISIHLLDAGSSILSSFDESLQSYALKKFYRDGINVRLNQKILRVEPFRLFVASGEGDEKGEKEVPFGLLVWSTGIKASPLTEQVQGVSKDARTKSILTDQYLRVLEDESTAKGDQASNATSKHAPLPDVFALGDCAVIDGQSLPATAQVAAQKAKYLAKSFDAHGLNNGGDARVQPFAYSNRGAMASIGGAKALIDLPRHKEAGFFAWVGWRGAYTIMSMTWRNRLAIPFTWFLNLLFGRDMIRF